MHRIVLLLATFSTTIAPVIITTDADVAINDIVLITTMLPPPPTVFRINSRSKPRRQQQQTRREKSDSPMLNYIFDTYATNNKHFHDKFRAPSFEDDKTSDVTHMEAATGATVTFDCRVTALREKLVSWVRVSEDENLKLLTIDLETHTADTRYRVDLAGDNWRLTLANATSHDSGIYYCHLSTHPPMLKRFELIVNLPEIQLSKEAFLESGETLTLRCAVLNFNPGSTVPELRWYKGNSTLSLDETRGGVLIETDHMNLTSHLYVADLKNEDAGHYTCALETPLKMKAIARVHVLQGSSLAELQSGVKTASSFANLLLTSLLLLLWTQNCDVR